MKQYLHILVFMVLSITSAAQPLAPCSGYLATVDESTQKIVLSWHRSTDINAVGYHICTGEERCLEYHIIDDIDDTSYICDDHSPLERHLYKLHVRGINDDGTPAASELTPHFGNMVLTAEVPECETDVQASWTPYVGMPSGNPRYTLWVKAEPSDDDYTAIYHTSDPDALHHSFEISDEDIDVWLKVEAEGVGNYHSWSNVVHVTRRTVDHADFIEITSVEYDSILRQVAISCHLDNSFAAHHYTLYRSIDGSPERPLATFSTRESRYTYIDRNINLFDSLHCYKLAVNDACGMNTTYSSMECVVVPTPPPPASAFPNTIVVGDPDNGCFLPALRGLMGNLYELSIYNRMGLLVFHTDNPDEGWTPPQDTPQGVYVYHLRCRFNTGTVKSYSGTVALIK